MQWKHGYNNNRSNQIADFFLTFERKVLGKNTDTHKRMREIKNTCTELYNESSVIAIITSQRLTMLGIYAEPKRKGYEKNVM